MTKYKLCCEGAPARSIKSPGFALKGLLQQTPFKTQDTSLETTSEHVTLWLDRGECVGLTAAHPLRLETAEGEAWVTIAGDMQDYLLTANQEMSIPSGARVVAQARTASRLTIK